MRILLIQPPVEDFYDTELRLQPIGLCYLKAVIEKHLPKVLVTVRDYHHGHGQFTTVLPKELLDLRELYSVADRSPFSTFSNYFHFGASYERIAADVASLKPDLIGISSLFSPYYREVLKTAEAIKRKRDVPILVGGSHVSARPESLLQDPNIDFVICGEGERPTMEFLKAFLSDRNYCSVPGFGYKNDGRIVLTPPEKNYPIEEIPQPDYSDLKPERYLYGKRPMCFIVSSRGCPYRCAFCSVHLTFREGYRRRPNASILKEIRLRYREGYRVFDFEDDNFSYRTKETKALCGSLKKLFPKNDVEFLAMNGVAYWMLDNTLLKLMREAGFTHLNLSLVSTNASLMKKVKRPHSLKKYISVVREAHRLGFKIISYQILGLPGESLQSMMRTLLVLAELPVLLGASPFYLTPGMCIAQDHAELKEGDLIKSRLTAMGSSSDIASRRHIYTLFITTRILNFLKGIRLSSPRVTLHEALKEASSQGLRMALGAESLNRLLDQGHLYAAVKDEFRILPHFESPIFFEIWSRLKFVATREGHIIANSSLVLKRKL